MLFWFILLAIGVIGTITVPSYRLFKPNNKTFINEPTFLFKGNFHDNLSALKSLTLVFIDKALSLSQKISKELYDKTSYKIKNTKFSGFLQGRGIIKQKDVTSNFLRDVKDHKDKIREELNNPSLEKDVSVE